MAARDEWIETTVLFYAVCVPKFTKLSTHNMYRNDCSLQCRFTIDDILLLSVDISDQAKLSKIAPENWCFWAANFGGNIFPGGGALVSCRHSLACVKF